MNSIKESIFSDDPLIKDKRYHIWFMVLLYLFLGESFVAAQVDTYEVLYDSVYRVVRSDERKKALPIFENLIKLSKKIKSDSLYFKTYEQYALYYFLEGDFSASAEHLITALDYAGNLPDKNSYWDTKNNLALIYSKLNEKEKSKDIYLEIYANTDVDTTSESYIATLSNLGSVYQDLNKLDSSRFFLKEAIKLSKFNNYRDLVASNLNFLSKNHVLSKHYDSAIVTSNELKTNYWMDLSPRQRDDAMYTSAQAHFFKGNFDLAQQDIDKAFDLMKVTKKDPAWIERLEFQSQVFEAQKNYKKALESQKQVTRLRDSFDSANRSAKVLEIEEKYKAEKKEKENLKLREETVKKDLSIAQKNNYILVGSILFSATIILLILYQLRRFQNKNVQLRSAINRRIKVEQELEIVRDNIAKDFHDDLGNTLARITALSDLMITSKDKRKKEETIEALEKIKSDSQELYKGTRDFMFSLRPESDVLEETVTYISDFGEDYFTAFDIDFFVNKSIQKDTKLPYYWNRQIILIFKEAITNVAKHAKAKKTIFNILQIKNELMMSLIDDGCGFDEHELNHKNGLKNLRARAEKMGAKLSIHSSSLGTEVRLNGRLPN